MIKLFWWERFDYLGKIFGNNVLQTISDKNNFDNIIIIRVFLYFAKVINEKEIIIMGIKKFVMLNSLSIKCEGIETVELYPTIWCVIFNKINYSL